MTLANRAAGLNSRRQADLPRLIMITDRARGGDPLRAASRLPAGNAVILRDYGHPDRARLARDLAALCRRRRLLLLIAGDPRLAAKVGADGLHLPEALAHRARAWRRRRPAWLITAAAHSLPALWRAKRAGADAALVGPVFATASHPGARTLGPLRFALLARLSPLPIYALGGVDAIAAHRLKGTGAHGFAAVGSFAGR